MSNLAKLFAKRGLGDVLFYDQPPESFLEVGEKNPSISQRAAAEKNEGELAKSYSQRTAVGEIRRYLNINGSTPARSPKLATPEHLEIKSGMQRQVPKRSQPAEIRGIDEMYLKPKASNGGSPDVRSELPPAHEQDTSLGKSPGMAGEFMKYPQINKDMCDVKIHVEGQAFHAHRGALSTFSPYFSNLFSKRAGNYQLPMIVTVSGISKNAFQVFMGYVYGKGFNINYGNVEEVITMADGFRIPFLKKQCIKLLNGISLEKAIRVLRGNLYSTDSRMFKFLVSRVSEDFLQLYCSKGFLELDSYTVCWILSNDDLQVSKEMDVFVLGLKWITHSVNKRQQYLAEVMHCVRFLCMTQDELFECFEMSDMLKKSDIVRKLILYANWILTAGTLKRGDPLNLLVLAERNCLSENPQQRKKNASAFFSAQVPRDLCVNIEQDPSEDKVTNLFQGRATSNRPYNDTGGNLQREELNTQVEQNIPSEMFRARYLTLPEPRIHEADAIIDRKMFFFGGSFTKLSYGVAVATDVAQVYSCETKTWTPIKSMHTPRYHHATCTLGGMVYVIGGEDDKSRVLSSVECYNPKTNAWFFVKSMMDPRLGASAAELDGKIIVTGGYGQSRSYITKDQVLCSVETYDPKLNRWRPLNDLRFPRCYSNLVNVQGKLYLCGGATSLLGSTELSSVAAIDVYNKNLGIWEEKTNLREARHHAGCKVTEGSIFFIGGVTEAGGQPDRAVECYNTLKDTWYNCRKI